MLQSLPKVICLLLCLISTQLYAQSLKTDSLKAEQMLAKKSYDAKERYQWAQEAAELFQKHQLQADYYKALLTAVNYMEGSTADAKQQEYKKLQERIEKELGADHIQNIRAKILYALEFNNLGQPKQTILLLDEILAEKELLKELPAKYQYSLYQNMSISYYQTQDIQRAGDYIIKAEAQAKAAQNDQLLAESKRLHAYYELITGQPKIAQEMLDEAMSLMRGLGYGQYSREMLFYWEMQTQIYYLGKQKDKMIALAESLTPYYIKYYGDSPRLVNHYTNIAAYYRDWRASGLEKDEKKRVERSRKEQAVVYSKKVIALCDKLNIRKGVDLSVLYRNLGTIYEDLDDPKTLETYMASLAALLPQIDSIANDEKLDILGQDLICYDYFLAMRTTRRIARYIEKKTDNDPNLIEARYYWYQQWESLLFLFKKRLSDDALGEYYKQMGLFTGENLRFYSKYGHEPNLEDVFRLMELNKNTQLLQNLKSSETAKLGGVSPEIVQEESQLKKEIADLEKAMLDAARAGEKDAQKAIETQIIDSRAAYDRFLAKMQEEAPQYYKLKYEANPYQLKEIQQILDQKTVLIEYHEDHDYFYSLLISKEDVKFQISYYDKKKKGKHWEEKVEDFRKLLTDVRALKDNPKTQFDAFTAITWEFYHDILQLDELLKGVDANHLIFIPSDALNFIPFEVLLTKEVKADQTDYSNLPYLMKDYAISYSYSASLLLENKGKNQSYFGGEMLGFAASYGDSLPPAESRTGSIQNLRNGLDDLPGAKAELEALQAAYKGDFFFAQKANESQFKSSDFERYNILHLAMHGLVDKENPFASSLAFTENGDSEEDNFVHAYELTQMEIGAALVVLSACETGYGRFEKGNGVASLARSFMYAGVPSLVVSLWQVNDASTNMIMQNFYANLAKGDDKAEALRQAKLKYLEQVGTANKIAAHPAFWAAFIQLGDAQPIALNKKAQFSYWILGLIGLGVILLLVVGLRFRKRINNICIRI
jgi:CHAT domain-containing protein